jgi:hypothetical protein
MTCRAARSFQHHTQMEPVSCCECGSTHLEVFDPSAALGPYLCPTCARSMVGCAVEKEAGAEPVR